MRSKVNLTSLIFVTFKSENPNIYIYFLYIRKRMTESAECLSLHCPFMCCNMYGKCPDPTSTDPKQNQCWDPSKNMPLQQSDNSYESNRSNNSDSNTQIALGDSNDDKREGQNTPAAQPSSDSDTTLKIVLGVVLSFVGVLLFLIIYKLIRGDCNLCRQIQGEKYKDTNHDNIIKGNQPPATKKTRNRQQYLYPYSYQSNSNNTYIDNSKTQIHHYQIVGPTATATPTLKLPNPPLPNHSKKESLMSGHAASGALSFKRII